MTVTISEAIQRAQEAVNGGDFVSAAATCNQLVNQFPGYAAAHRLLEMEDRLCRNPSESCNTFGNEVLHTLCNVRPLEKRRAIAFDVNKLVELLDLIT